jgi:hypothetical protein
LATRLPHLRQRLLDAAQGDAVAGAERADPDGGALLQQVEQFCVDRRRGGEVDEAVLPMLLLCAREATGSLG